MSNNPLISVVMSVYNSEKYLVEAIESILNQTYSNFEFIIINDGSSDNSLSIIKNYMKKDDRIILIDRENKGLAYSLNEGIEKAKGEYIARMDADDISLPYRFKKQINHLIINNLDICGGSIEFFSKNKSKVVSYPLNDNEIKFSLISMSPFAHPSVIIKKDVFNKIKYNNLQTAQDYDLWSQIAIMDFNMGNIPDIILKYRIHSNQITVKKRKIQKNYTYKISDFYIKNTKFNKNNGISNLNQIRSNATYSNTLQLFQDIIEEGKKEKIPDKILIELLRFIFRTLTPMKPVLLIAYLKSTKPLLKDFKGNMFIAIQSLLYLDINGKLYNFIRNKII